MGNTQNSLLDVHNLLMEQMERLMDAESTEEVERELARSKAVSDVAKVLVDNSKTMLDAVKTGLEYNQNFNGTILGIELKEEKR